MKKVDKYIYAILEYRWGINLTFSFVELFTTSTSRGKDLEVAKYSIAGS